MRYPNNIPQLFHEALTDFLNSLDLSIDRLAPFAGLHPEQLRRLGKDGKHHTLAPNAITRLLDAPMYVSLELTPEYKEAWSRHLKVASLYTILITAARRRTSSTWPESQEDFKFVWETAFDLVVYSGYALFHSRDGSYKTRDIRGFPRDSAALWDKWSKNELESEQNVLSALDEIDKSD